jgi:hypothetical protein
MGMLRSRRGAGANCSADTKSESVRTGPDGPMGARGVQGPPGDRGNLGAAGNLSVLTHTLFF